MHLIQYLNMIEKYTKWINNKNVETNKSFISSSIIVDHFQFADIFLWTVGVRSLNYCWH